MENKGFKGSRFSNFLRGIASRTILLVVIIAAGMVLMFFWYEVFTRHEFERTYYFLKNIPPRVIWENKEAYSSLMKTIPKNFHFNSSKINRCFGVQN